MDESAKDIEEYSIPFKHNLRLKLKQHILYVFLMVIFAACSFLPVGEYLAAAVYKIFMWAAALFFMYVWLYAGIFKKRYLVLDDGEIKFKTVFGSRSLEWNKIYDVRKYTMNDNTVIGIIPEEKIKRRKDTVWSETIDWLGNAYGATYWLSISEDVYWDVNLDKLYRTIYKMAEIANEGDEVEREVDGTDYCNTTDEPVTSNLPIALVKAFLSSVALGIVYGLSMHILKKNMIIIPVAGSIGIIYIYHSSYMEEKINIIIRILVGAICSLQVFIAMITTIYIGSKLPLNISNFNELAKEYFKYLISNPGENWIIIVLAVLSFGYGTFQGQNFIFVGRFGKVYLKKAGRYFYIKEGRFFTIYLKDPYVIAERAEERLVLQIDEGCFVEKEKDKLKSFYIPSKRLGALNVVMSERESVDIDGIMYYRIDLDSCGRYQKYSFTCKLLVNSDKEVEEVHIQI